MSNLEVSKDKYFMKLRIFTSLIAVLYVMNIAVAGNPDRQGQAGAPELLMNPWGRSAGLHSMTTSSAWGVEAMRINIAGLSRIKKGELSISNNRLFSGTDMNLNSLGFGTRLGENGALGIEFASLDFGRIPITTVNQPAGTGGVISPSFFQLGLGYSYMYANKISVGMLIRTISQSIPDASAFGFAIDAGVQYVNGPKDNFRLGISLRNIGSPMAFGGEGLSVRRENPDPAGGVTYEIAYDSRSASFELPSMLNLGISYDFYFSDDTYLRPVLNFTSNAFSRDQIGGGMELSYANRVSIRAGYKAELGATLDEVVNVYTGFSAGASVEVPISKGGNNNLGIDYAYRSTNPFRGTHNFTLRFSF